VIRAGLARHTVRPPKPAAHSPKRAVVYRFPAREGFLQKSLLLMAMLGLSQPGGLVPQVEPLSITRWKSSYQTGIKIGSVNGFVHTSLLCTSSDFELVLVHERLRSIIGER
jgi:hypothetical protein